MKYSCVVVVLAIAALASADDTFYNGNIKDAVQLYQECSKADGFSPCLKKKAVNYLDRLARMSTFSLGDGIKINHEPESPNTPPITEEQLDATLPRALDAKDAALSDIAINKVSNIIGSSTIEISMARFLDDDSESFEESRKKKDKKGGMGAIGMLLAAKLAALLPIKLAVVFFLAKKALIIAKIALLISGFIAIKKLLASKGGHDGGHYSGGGGGGWQSSGGGWDKRSLDEANTAQNLAYSAYKPQ